MTHLKFFGRVALAFSAALLCVGLSAQTSTVERTATPDQEKKINEFIQSQIDLLNNRLNLESWQAFYVDSILNHDYRALQEELFKLSSAKVSNSDIYVKTRDKWSEQMYNSIKGVLNETQWEKYLKSGALHEKKLRDKRAAKASKK